MAFTGDTGTGSGRSIAGVDLGAAVRKAVAAGILAKGGGHAMAAGITVERGQLAEFRAYLEETLGNAVEKARRDEALLVDAATTAGALTHDLVATIDRAGPFGSGNPEPVLALPAHVIAHVDELSGTHMRARLRSGDGRQVEAIAFRAAGQPLGAMLAAHRGKPLHLAGTASINRWQGQERVQFRILDAAVPPKRLRSGSQEQRREAVPGVTGGQRAASPRAGRDQACPPCRAP